MTDKLYIMPDFTYHLLCKGLHNKAFMIASLNTVRGISQISSLGPAPSILYATWSLLSSHAIACKYC